MGRKRAQKAATRRAPANPPPTPELPAAPRWPWYVAAGLTIWCFGFTLLKGTDLWWHLAAGRLIWQQRSPFLTDSWSFTSAGRPWLHHEWLADVVYHGWSRLLGREALVYWKWGLLLLTFLLLLKALHRISGHLPASFLATTFAVAVSAPFLDLRPHLYTLLGYVVLLHLAFLRERPSWLLPPLFLLWANLHGGFFFGLLALAVVIAVTEATEVLPSFQGSGRGWARSAGIWLACAGASLLNPNGIEAFLYPLKYAFDERSPFRTIDEWLPPFVPGGVVSPLYPLACALLAVAGLYVSFAPSLKGRRTRYMAALALAVLTLAMSLKSRRFIPLFAISEALVLAPALAAALDGLARPVSRMFQSPARRRAVALGLPLLFAGIAAVRLSRYPLSSAAAFPVLTSEETFPVELCRFIERNGLTGKVFSFYGWGGYLHLCTAGRLRVYIDSRADTVYEAPLYRDYVRVQYLQPGWVGVVESSGAEYFLWPHGSGHAEVLLQTGRWRELYRDFAGVLLFRSGHRLPELQPTPDSAYRRLALGGEAMKAGRMAEAAAHFAKALEMDPALLAACRNLAMIHAFQGDAEAAWETQRRCDRIFVEPESAAILRDLLQRSRA